MNCFIYIIYKKYKKHIIQRNNNFIVIIEIHTFHVHKEMTYCFMLQVLTKVRINITILSQTFDNAIKRG